MMNEVMLGKLKAGQKGVIRRIDLASEYEQRLAELGILPGAEIEVVQVAPLGDPIAIECEGRRMGIRLSDADGIVVAV